MKPQPRRKFKRCDTVAPSFRRPCSNVLEPLCPRAPLAPMRPCPICPCTQAPKLPNHQTPGSQFGKLSTSNPSYNPLSFASHAFHSRTRACIRNPGRPHPSRPVPAAEIAVSGNYFRSRTLAWPLFPSKFSQTAVDLSGRHFYAKWVFANRGFSERMQKAPSRGARRGIDRGARRKYLSKTSI